MRQFHILATGLLLALTAAAGAVRAQVPDADPVTWTVSADPAPAEPGDVVLLNLSATIEGDWRMYAMDSPVGKPLDVRFDETAAFERTAPVSQPEPNQGFDPTLGRDYTYFTEAVSLSGVFRVTEAATDGAAPIAGTIRYMVCNDELCLPPTRHPFEVPVQIRNASVAAEARPAAPPSAAGSPPAEPPRAAVPEALGDDEAPVEDEAPASAVLPPVADASPQGPAPPGAEEEVGELVPLEPAEERRSGLWGFVLLAIGAGLAALLTPCVFPMIPLTVSFFLHRAGDRRKAARMAGVYGLSIVGLFTGLGIAMALVVGAAGPQLIAANPFVNLFIGLVLVVFGFSLLGFYELRPPAGLMNYFNRQSDERGGYLGVLFMGLTLVLVSFSCTVPFVGGLLAATVQGGWGYPLLGMVIFSSVFALPFVLFAVFPNALSRLPRSGSWMGALKGVLGFVEIAAALKFFSNADLVWGTGLLPRPLAIALMIVIFALTGFYLIGKLTLKSPEAEVATAPQPVGGLRLFSAIAFFGFAFYLMPGLLGAPLGGFDAFLPPRQATDVSLLAGMQARVEGSGAFETHGGVAWHQSRTAAFEESRRTGRPVLIDFTGYTCTNCRHMEATVLSQPAIAQRIDRSFVPLQLWTDNAETGPALQRYQLELTGRIALPTYAVVHPDGQLVSQLSGVTSEERYAAFLDAAAATFEQTDALALR
jgi:thiol:disulfide interchange protein DsbD